MRNENRPPLKDLTIIEAESIETKTLFVNVTRREVVNNVVCPPSLRNDYSAEASRYRQNLLDHAKDKVAELLTYDLQSFIKVEVTKFFGAGDGDPNIASVKATFHAPYVETEVIKDLQSENKKIQSELNMSRSTNLSNAATALKYYDMYLTELERPLRQIISERIRKLVIMDDYRLTSLSIFGLELLMLTGGLTCITGIASDSALLFITGVVMFSTSISWLVPELLGNDSFSVQQQAE